MIKQKFSIFTLMKCLFLITILLSIVLPLLHIVAVSLSSNIKIMNNEVFLLPKGFTLQAYSYVLTDERVLLAYRNTVIYVIIGTLLSLSTTAAAAYALSKKRLFLHRVWMIGVIITMFFSGGMIPTYLTIRKLGIYNTMWVMILPSLISSWNLIVMRSFFIAFPEEIEESGKIDGLNDIGVFFYLVLPVSKASLSTIGLFYAVGIWNSYFTPFLYIETKELFPLQIILRSMLVSGTSMHATSEAGGDITMVPESLKYATVIVSILPIMMVYPFIQKYFVKGVMVGAVKG